MAKYWRNVGAPFDLPDGRPVPRGYVFAASASAAVVVRRRKKLRPASPSDGPKIGEVPPLEDPAELYPGIPFGSPAAFDLARDEVLSVDDLQQIEGSGERQSEFGSRSILKGDIEAYLRDRGA